VQDVETAQALADKAAAEVAAIEARLDGCNISAPYDGYVSELAVNQYEMPALGAPLMTIVSTAEPEIELIVPSVWLQSLVAGREFSFHIDETGQSHVGRVDRTAAVIDAVSQTVKVFASFASDEATALPGMSGTAEF
jgi:membrane fusion protein (multidrug efflux system)